LSCICSKFLESYTPPAIRIRVKVQSRDIPSRHSVGELKIDRSFWHCSSFSTYTADLELVVLDSLGPQLAVYKNSSS
jgi:hypothetical protein